MVTVERDGMFMADHYAGHQRTQYEDLERMAQRIVKDIVHKTISKKIEEMIVTRDRLMYLLKCYSSELPPAFIQIYKREINTLTEIIDWIEKEID